MDSSGNLAGGAGTYSSGELHVEKLTDEDLHASYTFTDKQGRTLLERRMDGAVMHDTYYVYDRFDRLRFVLQPMYQQNADLAKYAFCYTYDGCGRCISRKLPGASEVEYRYNSLNQLIYSRDGNQRAAGRWTFYGYDSQNRLVSRGECIGESPSSSGTVHLVNLYDGYPFVGTSGFPAARFPADASGYGRGLLTGSIVTLPEGNGTKVYIAHYYDAKGRMVKTVRSNLLGGYDETVTAYTFTDKPSTVTYTHTASGKPTVTQVYTYSYDHADRLLKVKHRFGGTEVTLADYEYNSLGQLKQKNLHGLPLHRQEYKYNLRGWLTGINGNYFAENLYYNTGDNPAKCYNGNISSVKWGFNGPPRDRRYLFSYDGLNRLTNADFSGTSQDSNYPVGNFAERVTGYDKNGNLLGLQRYGQTGASAFGLIDDLTYTLNGNLLNRVDDAVTASAYNNGFEFKDAVKQANEYTYDANGNLTKDLNKGITEIQYNVLNLPNVVTFSDGSTITYTYAADGTKLKVVHKIGNATTTTDYCGNVVYENGVQKRLLTEEGYVTLDDGNYHYFYKDHLGNVRLVMKNLTASSGSIEERNDYYPFGGLIADLGNVQPYKYNGKELDAKKGLNLLDYGARMYDPVLGRFTTVDPLSEKYCPISPYVYCGNNPIDRIDPFGMDYWSTNNPEVIRQFLEAAKEHSNASGNFLNVVDFSSWNHSTDAEFLSNLTFNDQTNMFYSNYGTIENGVVTSIGVSFPALGNNGESAWLEGGKGRWYKRASGKLDNLYPEFDLFFASTKSGWNILKDVFTSMFRPFSTTNTFDASRSGIIRNGGNREKMGRAKGNMSGNRAVQDEQINSLCRKYNLDKNQRQTLHRLIDREGLGYQEIEQLIKEYFRK